MNFELSIDTNPEAYAVSRQVLTTVRAVAAACRDLLDLQPDHVEPEQFPGWLAEMGQHLTSYECEVVRAAAATLFGTRDLEEALKGLAAIARTAGCHPATLLFPMR